MVERDDHWRLIGREELRGTLTGICAFVALLSWWIGLTGYVNAGGFATGFGGVLAFLVLPAWITALAVLLVRVRLRHSAKRRAGRRRPAK
jgi:hypothetical protein